MDISIDESTRRSILLADGYYISARYPGEDSFFVSDADKKDCIEALEACKSFVDKTIDVLNERQADRDEI
jgi:hypothetical protein